MCRNLISHRETSFSRFKSNLLLHRTNEYEYLYSIVDGVMMFLLYTTKAGIFPTLLPRLESYQKNKFTAWECENVICKYFSYVKPSKRWLLRSMPHSYTPKIAWTPKGLML